MVLILLSFYIFRLPIQVSPEFGGAGRDSLCYTLAMEEISRACAGTGTGIDYETNALIGPRKCNFPPMLREIMTDRQTD